MTPEDARLFVESDLERAEVHDFCGGQVVAFSRSCATRSGPNQDAAALIPYDAERGVLVVADGAGGARGGTQASSTTVYELCAALEHGCRDGLRLREAILDGIEAADREIQALAIGAATTLALVEIDGSAVRPYHVGDSQVLVVGQRGRLKLLTPSHSPVGYAELAGFLDDEEAIRHEDRHFVSNVLGIPEMTIELGARTELSSMDTLLVASDGLFDNLTKDEIIERVRTGNLEEAVRSLVDACTERMAGDREGEPGKPDDLTVLAFRRSGGDSTALLGDDETA